jgi:hypothetical protein
VESPEQRVAAGKPEAASIQLSGVPGGRPGHYEVSTMAKIDPTAIRLKAFEKG